jgi:hypothetical protein
MIGDENRAQVERNAIHTCSITRVCRSSQCLSITKTSVLRKNGPKTSTMPGHRMSSSVMKDLIKLLRNVSCNINPLCGERTVVLPTSLGLGQQITGASCQTVRCHVEQEQHNKQCVRVP